MSNWVKERSGYVFDDKGQLLLVTAPCSNISDVVQRIQLFLLDMDLDSCNESIRAAIYQKKLHKQKYYFSFKLKDNGCPR